MKVTLRHTITGDYKQVKIGFSWTMLFFGGWVPLLRGDLKHLLLHGLFLVLSFGLSELIYPFIYNRWYINDQLRRGYWPATDRDKAVLRHYEFIR